MTELFDSTDNGELAEKFWQVKRTGFAFKEDLFGNRSLKVPYKFLHLVNPDVTGYIFPKTI